MKKYFKICSFIFIMIGLLVLASCDTSSKSGVKGTMTFTTTKDSISIDVSFDANENLKNGLATPYIQCYTVTDGESKYKTKQNLSLDSSYVHSTTTFTSLDVDTEYEFILKITFDGNDEVIDKKRQKTLAKGVTSDEAIEISTVDQFLDMKNDPDAHYTLVSDIDFNGTKVSELFDSSNKFTGSFNGNNHSITNFKLSSTKSTKYLGLFGYTDGAEISNLKITNVTCESLSITTAGYIGACIGYANNTTVKNVYVDLFTLTISCNSTSTLNLGGFVGASYASTYEGVDVNATLTVNNARLKANIGLFAGYTSGVNKNGLVKNAFASGSLLVKPTFTDSSKDVAFVNCGGFIGQNDSKSLIENCLTDCELTVARDASASSVNFDLNLGGFIGYTNSSNNISKSCAIADLFVFSGKQPETKDDAKTLCSQILTVRKAYIGGFIGNLNQSIIGVSSCWYAPKHYGVTVYCKQNNTEETNEDNVFISLRYAHSTQDIASKVESLYVYETQINTNLETITDCSSNIKNDVAILSEKIRNQISNRVSIVEPEYYLTADDLASLVETPSTGENTDGTETPSTGENTDGTETPSTGENTDAPSTETTNAQE